MTEKSLLRFQKHHLEKVSSLNRLHATWKSVDEGEVSVGYSKMLVEVTQGGGIRDNCYFLFCAVMNFLKILVTFNITHFFFFWGVGDG